jgi:hypothetical protein
MKSIAAKIKSVGLFESRIACMTVRAANNEGWY